MISNLWKHTANMESQASSEQPNVVQEEDILNARMPAEHKRMVLQRLRHLHRTIQNPKEEQDLKYRNSKKLDARKQLAQITLVFRRYEAYCQENEVDEEGVESMIADVLDSCILSNTTLPFSGKPAAKEAPLVKEDDDLAKLMQEIQIRASEQHEKDMIRFYNAPYNVDLPALPDHRPKTRSHISKHIDLPHVDLPTLYRTNSADWTHRAMFRVHPPIQRIVTDDPEHDKEKFSEEKTRMMKKLLKKQNVRRLSRRWPLTRAQDRDLFAKKRIDVASTLRWIDFRIAEAVGSQAGSPVSSCDISRLTTGPASRDPLNDGVLAISMGPGTISLSEAAERAVDELQAGIRRNALELEAGEQVLGRGWDFEMDAEDMMESDDEEPSVSDTVASDGEDPA